MPKRGVFPSIFRHFREVSTSYCGAPMVYITVPDVDGVPTIVWLPGDTSTHVAPRGGFDHLQSMCCCSTFTVSHRAQESTYKYLCTYYVYRVVRQDHHLSFCLRLLLPVRQ